MKKLSWLRNDNKLFLLGELSKDSLNPLWNIRYKIIEGVSYIDLKNISKADTAGIALLIHFIEFGKIKGININILNVNDNILSLTKLYNLPKDILPIKVML